MYSSFAYPSSAFKSFSHQFSRGETGQSGFFFYSSLRHPSLRILPNAGRRHIDPMAWEMTRVIYWVLIPMTNPLTSQMRGHSLNGHNRFCLPRNLNKGSMWHILMFLGREPFHGKRCYRLFITLLFLEGQTIEPFGRKVPSWDATGDPQKTGLTGVLTKKMTGRHRGFSGFFHSQPFHIPAKKVKHQFLFLIL